LWSTFVHREKFFQEVNSVHLKSGVPLAKTKSLVKSLMNRTELLLHVTIAPHCRSLNTTPAGTPGTPQLTLPYITTSPVYSTSLAYTCFSVPLS
jgi:hypothetical protein